MNSNKLNDYISSINVDAFISFWKVNTEREVVRKYNLNSRYELHQIINFLGVVKSEADIIATKNNEHTKRSTAASTWQQEVYKSPKLEISKYICFICGTSSSDASGFSYHLNKMHQLSRKQYYDNYLDGEQNCNVCGKTVKFISIDAGYESTCAECRKLIRKKNYNNVKQAENLLKSYHCQVCNIGFDTLRGLSYHISHVHKINQQEYYDTYLKSCDEGICKYCGKPTKFLNLTDGYQKYCNSYCGGKGSSAQGHATMLLKYGVKAKNNPEATRQRWQSMSSDKKESIAKKVKETRAKNNGSVKQSYLDQAEKTKSKMEQHIKSLEKKYDATMLYTLVREYGQGFYKAQIVDVIVDGSYRFIKNSDIPKIIKYTQDTASNQQSHMELEVADYIKSIYSKTIILRDRLQIKPYELDIYIPDKKVAVEFNGTFWHSQLAGTDKQYHEKKSLACQNKGIHLIHIYEHEWVQPECNQKIKDLLKLYLCGPDVKLYARNCQLKKLNNSDTKDFLNSYHIQGNKNAQVVYGLFNNDELVQMMSFSYNLRRDRWEIERSCSKAGYIVVGGLNKLVSHFIKEYHPKRIFSYCDFNKFDGSGYEKIGMKFVGYTGPNMWWWLNNGDVVNRNPSNHKQLKENAKSIIYGAGSKKYLLEIK